MYIDSSRICVNKAQNEIKKNTKICDKRVSEISAKEEGLKVSIRPITVDVDNTNLL